MTLRTLFAIPIAVILLVTLSLAGMIASQGWTGQARGKLAVEAVEHMRLLLQLQTDLRGERVVYGLALGAQYPLPEPMRQRIDTARGLTDRAIDAVVDARRRSGDFSGNAVVPEPYLATVVVRLGMIRVEQDNLIAQDRSRRTADALTTIMGRMITAYQALDGPLREAGLAVTRADPTLSGLVADNRLTESLREQIGQIAAILTPHFNSGEKATIADQDQLRIFLARASYLTRLLSDMIEIAGATRQMRMSLVELRTIDVDGMLRKLDEQVAATPGSDADVTPLVPAWQLAPWSQRVDALRATIGDAMVKRVTAARAEQERRCDLVLTAFGTVLFAVLEAVVLLTQRVVKPLSYLGQAITRIANGDRGVPLVLQSGTSEITEMVTAVETLRQAALVADATASRQRMAARHRLDQLRQALGIAGSVQEPARALERGVSRLSEGLDATIALIATATDAPPPTLGTAAIAVRLGLADMRESAADLDASFAAASSAQEEDRPEGEYLSHILTVQAQVDRRDRVVRAFVRPSLAALRDASGAMGEAPGPGLRELVTDQFARIEETVAMVASMRDAVARATAIVRGLPLDDTPMAA